MYINIASADILPPGGEHCVKLYSKFWSPFRPDLNVAYSIDNPFLSVVSFYSHLLSNTCAINELVPRFDKPLLSSTLTSCLCCLPGPTVSDKGGIYRGINRYKPPCYKQVSDTKNV